MPVCIVNTPVQLSADEEQQMLTAIEKALADIIKKPTGYCMTGLNRLSSMRFGGSNDPAAFCVLHSIGGLSGDNNKKLSNAVSSAIQQFCKVPPSRVYIQFYDSAATNFGYNGSVF